MNVFDNEIVLEYLEGSVLFRDIVTGTNKTRILYTGIDPNGNLFAEPGSVAFGPAGSWENISVPILPDTQGSVWQLIGSGVTVGDGFLAPNEFWVDPTFPFPGPTGREVATIQEAIDLADTLFAAGISIVIRLREGQEHTWPDAAVSPNRDIVITAIGQAFGEEVDASVAGRILMSGTGVSLLANTGVRRNLEIRDLAISGPILVHEGWNLTLRETVTDDIAITVDQGGAGATNPVLLLLEDCSGESARFALNQSPLTITTTNYSGALATATILRVNRCSLQGVVTDASGERFMELGNTFALFDGTTFEVKSESDGTGLWVGFGTTPGPTNGTFLEFIGSSIVGNFDTAALFDRPLFSFSPTIRFTGLTIDALDVATGMPTPRWEWASGPFAPQGYPMVRNAKPPKMQIPGASVTDETLNTSQSGLGPVTERVASGLGWTVTGGRLVYGTVRVGPTPGSPSATIPLFSQAVSSDGPLLTLQMLDDHVYRLDLNATIRTFPIGLLVGWASGRLSAVIQVTGGVASFVSIPVWTPVAGGDLFLVTASIVGGDEIQFDAVFPAGSPAGSSAEVEVEISLLAV